MKIREQSSIVTTSPGCYRDTVRESIAELEEQLREGKITWHAYVLKKRSLVKML